MAAYYGLRDSPGGVHDGDGADDGHGGVFRNGVLDGIPGLKQPDGGGDEHDGHNLDEESARLVDVGNLDPFAFEGDEEQDDAVDAGGNGQREEGVQDFAGEGESNDDEELLQKSHWRKVL